eukprot:jgi/Mesvir1/20023/Mv13275-RA.1
MGPGGNLIAIPPELVERLIRLLPDTTLTKSAPMTAENNPDAIIQKAFEQNIVPTYASPSKGVYGEKSGHVVAEGETWKSIAEQYGVLPDELIISNPHISPLGLAPGSFVLIPKRYSFQDFVNGVIHPDTNMGLTYESNDIGGYAGPSGKTGWFDWMKKPSVRGLVGGVTSGGAHDGTCIGSGGYVAKCDGRL